MTQPWLLADAVACVASFFICAIPFGLLLSRWIGHVDVRTVGSGNIGSTNVVRAAGAKVGGLTLLCDLGKGLLCTLVTRLVLSGMVPGGPEALALSADLGVLLTLVYAACVFGHCFSPYLGFNGGKGIAVGFGAALGFMPLVALGLLAVFLAVAIPTRYVSAGSSAAAFSLPFLALFIYGARVESVLALACVGGVVIWRHRANLGRLMRGEESKFSFHGSKDKNAESQADGQPQAENQGEGA